LSSRDAASCGRRKSAGRQDLAAFAGPTHRRWRRRRWWDRAARARRDRRSIRASDRWRRRRRRWRRRRRTGVSRRDHRSVGAGLRLGRCCACRNRDCSHDYKRNPSHSLLPSHDFGLTTMPWRQCSQARSSGNQRWEPPSDTRTIGRRFCAMGGFTRKTSCPFLSSGLGTLAGFAPVRSPDASTAGLQPIALASCTLERWRDDYPSPPTAHKRPR
jgi:hypothetical protein